MTTEGSAATGDVSAPGAHGTVPQQPSRDGQVAQEGLRWVMIWASQMRTGGLPALCWQTGRQTNNWVPVKFAAGSVRVTGVLPWDVRAAHRTRFLRTYGRIGVAIGLAALVAFAVVANAVGDMEEAPGAVQVMSALMVFLGPLIFVIGLVLWINGNRLRPRGTVWKQEGSPDDPVVVLRQVHPGFAMAVRAQQRTTGPSAPAPSLVGAGQPRRLVTNYEDGHVLVEGGDIILIERGRELRAPLSQAEVTHYADGWLVKITDTVHSTTTIREPDDKPALDALVGETRVAVASALVEGRRVQREFGPIEIIFEDGYLTMAKLSDRAPITRVPTHLVDGAAKRTRQVQKGIDKKSGQITYRSESVLTLFGGGTTLGEVSFMGLQDSHANAAEVWVNTLLRALRLHQQELVSEAREHHVRLVKCLYCGTRVQDVGRCNHCGAPLPQP